MHKTEWNNFQLMVFDCPQPPLIRDPYFQRYFFLKNEVEKGITEVTGEEQNTERK